jgi:hypothetical protein
MRRVAKSRDAATVVRAEHAFAATGIYPYRLNISDEDIEPSEITRQDKMPDETLEGTKNEHSNVGSPLHVDGLICLHLPLHEHPII